MAEAREPSDQAVPAARMQNVSRRFGAVQALDRVDFTIHAGMIQALVGENGAGKTTLMRILYGADRPDAGSVEVFGSKVAFHRAADGIAQGIGMVSQHYSIIPELTCLENLMLGAEPGWAISVPAARARAQELAERMNFAFDWDASARHLSPASAQKLEILKLLWRNARIMILDEPTAMLSPADSDQLFGSLQSLADAGAGVVVVTHRLPEVFAHCQNVTVLREGRVVASGAVADTTPPELAEAIVGKAVDLAPRASGELSDQVALEVDRIRARGYRGDWALKHASLQVRKGEILGIAGVDGSGQRELFWALFGALPIAEGTVRLEGQDLTRASVAERIRRGIRIIPEDRHEEGVIDPWSLDENACLGLQRRPEFVRGPFLQRDALRRWADAMARRFQTKHGGLHLPMESLSGGNQQRFVAARAMAIEPRLILAFQPARGLDIEATQQVYEGLAAECREGAAAIVVSFDLDELIDHCDRVVAMNAGVVREPAPGRERDRQAIGELMVATG